MFAYGNRANNPIPLASPFLRSRLRPATDPYELPHEYESVF